MFKKEISKILKELERMYRIFRIKLQINNEAISNFTVFLPVLSNTNGKQRNAKKALYKIYAKGKYISL